MADSFKMKYPSIQFEGEKLVDAESAVGANTNRESRTAWQQMLALLGRTNARPLVDSVFPYNQLPQAFARMAAGPMGKVIVQVLPAA
jgi:NADPH:quinone reductase-like Zn-dependent oxidoreductase